MWDLNNDFGVRLEWTLSFVGCRVFLVGSLSLLKLWQKLVFKFLWCKVNRTRHTFLEAQIVTLITYKSHWRLIIPQYTTQPIYCLSGKHQCFKMVVRSISGMCRIMHNTSHILFGYLLPKKKFEFLNQYKWDTTINPYVYIQLLPFSRIITNIMSVVRVYASAS